MLAHHPVTFVLSFLAALVAVATFAMPARALDRGGDGYYTTGNGVRVKKVVIVKVDVYSITHAMKQLPASRSKQAVLQMDVDKKIDFTMLRTVDAEKLQNAMKDGFEMNGYGDQAKIGQFVGAFTNELKEGQSVHIRYDAGSKTTTISVEGGGSANVRGVDFMHAVWSLWFGNIDQPELGDALISRI